MTTTYNLQKIAEFEHSVIYKVEDKEVIVVEATATYIPMSEFKELFNKAGELAKEHGINKLVFDKRKLNVFHQPSMEWYFTEWKDKVYDSGLRTHRKILPEDEIFRESVKLGRTKIDRENPNGKFHKMDIRYSADLNDAIKN